MGVICNHAALFACRSLSDVAALEQEVRAGPAPSNHWQRQLNSLSRRHAKTPAQQPWDVQSRSSPQRLMPPHSSPGARVQARGLGPCSMDSSSGDWVLVLVLAVVIITLPGGVCVRLSGLRKVGRGLLAAAPVDLLGGLTVLLVDRAATGGGLMGKPLTGLCTDGAAVRFLARGGWLVVWRFCLVVESGALRMPGVRVVE